MDLANYELYHRMASKMGISHNLRIVKLNAK